MANPEHVEIVNAGRKSIETWRAKNHKDIINLTEADLRKADLILSNLRWAKLFKADLREALLGGADLTRADLEKARLNKALLCAADLNAANLNGANLSEADLSEANLNEANLIDTDLRWSNLSNTILSEANLIRTNLSGAVIDNTIFSNVDLSSVIGLDSIQHHGPSTIGIDTLYLSGGKIPSAFLRGCGVPDEFINFIPSLTNQPFQFYSVFISYSHNDKAFARQLYDTLQGRGIRCWLDEKQILPGDDVRTSIDHGIKVWDKVLLCASKESLNSNWCDKEIRKAFSKEEKLNSKPSDNIRAIIPLNLDGYMFKDDWQSPYATDIRERHAPDFTNWKRNHNKYEQQVEKVIAALALNDGMRELPPTPILGREAEM